MFKLLLVALAAVFGLAAASPAYYATQGLGYVPSVYSGLPLSSLAYNNYPLTYATYPASLGYRTLPLAYTADVPFLWKKK